MNDAEKPAATNLQEENDLGLIFSYYITVLSVSINAFVISPTVTTCSDAENTTEQPSRASMSGERG